MSEIRNALRALSLGKLIGKDNADELKDSLTDAGKTLDARGVARKALTISAANLDEVSKQIAADVLASGSDLSKATADDLAAIVKAVLETAVAASEAKTEEKPAEGEATKAKEGDGLADETVKSLIIALQEQNKQLSEAVAEMIDDSGEVARAVVVMAGSMPGLLERVEGLESIIQGRPRQASKDAATVFDQKKAEDEAKKGLPEGDIHFLGVKVKEQPK